MSEISARNMSYSALSNEDRARLLATVDMSDTEAAMASLTLFNSDQEVSEKHGWLLGWFQTFILGLNDRSEDVEVTRRKKNGRHGSLEQFLASLDGHQYDPDSVVYVLDENGDEVHETIGTGPDKRRVPLVEARQNVTRSGVLVRLDNGETFTLKDGRTVTLEDVGGHDNYVRIVDFSRDGGATWELAEWKLTLPKKRKN